MRIPFMGIHSLALHTSLRLVLYEELNGSGKAVVEGRGWG